MNNRASPRTDTRFHCVEGRSKTYLRATRRLWRRGYPTLRNTINTGHSPMLPFSARQISLPFGLDQV